MRLIRAAMSVLLGSPTFSPANKGLLARFGFVPAVISCCGPSQRATNDFNALPTPAARSTQHRRDTSNQDLFSYPQQPRTVCLGFGRRSPRRNEGPLSWRPLLLGGCFQPSHSDSHATILGIGDRGNPSIAHRVLSIVHSRASSHESSWTNSLMLPRSRP
jgi:hypothetical protein